MSALDVVFAWAPITNEAEAESVGLGSPSSPFCPFRQAAQPELHCSRHRRPYLGCRYSGRARKADKDHARRVLPIRIPDRQPTTDKSKKEPSSSQMLRSKTQTTGLTNSSVFFPLPCSTEIGRRSYRKCQVSTDPIVALRVGHTLGVLSRNNQVLPAIGSRASGKYRVRQIVNPRIATYWPCGARPVARTKSKRSSPKKRKSGRFENWAGYCRAVFTFALRLSDDPVQPVLLIDAAFTGRRTLQGSGDEVRVVAMLLSLVIKPSRLSQMFAIVPDMFKVGLTFRTGS